MTYSRVRFRNNLQNGTSVERTDQFYTTSCGIAPTWQNVYTSTPIYYSFGSYSSMRDCVTPGFSSSVRKGLTFFNPMEKVDVTLDPGPDTSQEIEYTTRNCVGMSTEYKQRRRCGITGGLTLGGKLSGFGIRTYPDGTVAPLDALDLGAIADAVTEATTRAQSERGRSDANLWEALAEIDKTLGVVSSVLSNIARAVSSKRSLLERAKGAGNAYLAWRYGIQPNYSDLRKALKGLDAAVGKVRKTSRGVTSFSTSYTTSTTGYWDFTTITGKKTFREQVNVRVSILDEVEATLGGNVGFSLTDLLTLPWELVPYSFVADWFVNIGDLLGALVPLVGVRQLGSSTVVERVNSITYESTNVVATGGYVLVKAPVPSASVVSHVKNRSTSLVNVGLVVKQNFGLQSLTRALDATALIVQKLR